MPGTDLKTVVLMMSWMGIQFLTFFAYLALAVMIQEDFAALEAVVRDLCTAQDPRDAHAAVSSVLEHTRGQWELLLALHVMLEGAASCALWFTIFWGMSIEREDVTYWLLHGMNMKIDSRRTPPRIVVFADLLANLTFLVFKLGTMFMHMYPVVCYNGVVQDTMDELDVMSPLFKLMYYRPLTFGILGMNISSSSFQRALQISLSVALVPALKRVTSL